MIIPKLSPNFEKKRQGYQPEAIVIHIMDGTLTGTDSWFGSTASQVSAHYGIGKTGEIHQYVADADTAWHAGRVDTPTWSLLKPGVNPNLYTLGIEHEGGPTDLWPEAQKQASADLIRTLCNQYQIPIDRKHIIGHYEIFSKKPNCPGVSKAIIDELVSRAAPVQKPTIQDAIKRVEDALAVLKSL